MNEFRVDIDRETALGRYANLAIFTHTKNEFIMDFALLTPQGGAVMVSRIITSPEHAKALMRSLAENISRYEQNFGHITEPPAPSNPS